jgi:hypothetical protein
MFSGRGLALLSPRGPKISEGWDALISGGFTYMGCGGTMALKTATALVKTITDSNIRQT